MRLKNKNAAHYDSGPNLTSLVDVVMVVLIFLMLAGAFSSIRVLTGKPALHGNQKGAPAQALSLDIRVQEDPAGSFIASAPDLRVAGDSGQLLSDLQTRRQKYLAAGISPDDVQVVIRPAQNTSYQHVLAVYEAVGRARFPRVAFAASN